jgi:glycosyltransferase involved in cell wall biosynthesis
MAVLAHGRPVVTTSGGMTEPVWHDSGAVATSPEGDADGLARHAADLLADRDALARLGEAARQAYERHFALERTVEVLLGSAERDHDARRSEEARAAGMPG